MGASGMLVPSWKRRMKPGRQRFWARLQRHVRIY